MGASLVEVEIEYEEVPELAASGIDLENIFDVNITPYSKDEDIKMLQKILTKLEVYDGEIDGNYQNMKEAFIDYQIEKKIIFSRTAPGAGYWGPKSKAQAKIDLEVIVAIQRQKDIDAELEKKRQEFLKEQKAT